MLLGCFANFTKLSSTNKNLFVKKSVLFKRLQHTHCLISRGKSVNQLFATSKRRTLISSQLQLRRNFYINEGSSEPFAPIVGRYPKVIENPEEAFVSIADNAKIFIHGGAATPTALISGLCKYAKQEKLKNLRAFHIHLEGSVPFCETDYNSIIRSESLFTGANCRKAVNLGYADFTPIFLSEIPLLFRRREIELDMALISVSPPDRHGFCSLGVSVDVTRSAIQNARLIVALVNTKMPRTRGDASVHVSHIDYLYNCNAELPQLKKPVISKAEDTIGKLIAHELIEDEATLQTGIGAIPSSVLTELTGHKNLGVHTEMFSDEMVNLVHLGAVTNAKKVIRPGVIVSSFVIGTKKVFDFIDDNAFVEMRDCAWTNSTAVICRNPKVTAINSCIEVDLTGQVVSDSIGQTIYSGVGGQVDFIRGASLCTNGRGKPIIALCSTTRKGASKIVPILKAGGGVVTTRANVHYIVTEYGYAQLFGRNLRQRAYDLIRIAHPDHREELEKAAFMRLKCMPSPN